MCTSLVLFALSGVFTPGITEGPQFSDYSVGMRRSERENKPIAVFIGAGKSGWEKLSQEGKLSKSVCAKLSSDYVCVYIDASQEEELAAAFEVQGKGLIISNAGGRLQAFRHEGDLGNEDLEHYLGQYSDRERVVRHTEDTRRTYYTAPAQPSAAPVCRT
jgi:hypothetical protein